MADVMIWDPYERFIWGIGITLTLMCGIYFILKGRKKEVFNEKMIMFGLASLPLGFASSLIITSIQVIQVRGIFNYANFTFYGDYNNYSSVYVVLEIIRNAILGIGGLFFVLSFELIVRRTKYILTIMFSIFIALLFFLPLITMEPLSTARSIFNFLIIPGLVIIVPYVLYLYTKWSRPEFKAVSSFFLFGFLSFIFSLILALRAHKSLNWYSLFLSPILLILGCIIIVIPMIIKPELITRALFYWVFFAFLAIPLIVFILIVDITIFIERRPEAFSFLYIIEILVLVIYVYTLFYLIIRNTRSELASKKEEKEKKVDTDVLGIFTRRQKITEEEVTVSKEKKICLVCKGKLERKIYICPECDTFYCNKCADTLSNLENICWVCNHPFDESKPVRSLKQEEEIEEISPSDQSQKKNKKESFKENFSN
ncbi:MAG: hypothetical protein ACFFB0_00385 [Promethearchaeota archaeon]